MPSAYVGCLTTEDAEATEALLRQLSSFFSLCPQFSLWLKPLLVPAEGRAVSSVVQYLFGSGRRRGLLSLEIETTGAQGLNMASDGQRGRGGR